MLDNMDLETMRLAVQRIRAISPVVKIEASGNGHPGAAAGNCSYWGRLHL